MDGYNLFLPLSRLYTSPFPLLLPILTHFENWPRHLCVHHLRCRLQCVAGHCYYQLSVFFSFLFLRLLLLTHFGETPKAEKNVPPIF